MSRGSMSISAFLIALAIHLILAITVNQDGPIEPGTFPNKEVLDKNFTLEWNFNSTHIIFKTTVKTQGYVGFGLSAHGKMFPADVIIGWVSDGKVYFGERHAIAHQLPKLVKNQNWHLLNGSKVDDVMTFTTIRKLDTCDPDDIVIKEGTTRVIYAYNNKDPGSESNIDYHGPNFRGTKALLLLDPPSPEKPLPADARNLDLLNQNYSVPGADTTYSCTVWKLPDLKGKSHMIRYEPVIQKGHELLVHHMILYFCTQPLDDKYVGQRFDCYNDWWYEPLVKCQSAFIAWAIGGKVFNYPDHVGHSLGASNDPVYFRLETHYDNPAMRKDFVDSSGLRLVVTKHLRTHDAGILEAGVQAGYFQAIPPYNKHFLSQGFCHQDCLAEGIGDQKMNVFANLLHSHLAGRQLRTRIIRNGTELPPLMQDENYDFDFQETRLLTKERVIEKGDALIVECVYDTSDRFGLTMGGLSTHDEMCLSFLLYYPRTMAGKCLSMLRYDKPDGGKFQPGKLSTMDWTRNQTQTEFLKVGKEAPIVTVCRGDKPMKFDLTSTPQIEVKKPYNPPDPCHHA